MFRRDQTDNKGVLKINFSKKIVFTIKRFSFEIKLRNFNLPLNTHKKNPLRVLRKESPKKLKLRKF